MQTGQSPASGRWVLVKQIFSGTSSRVWVDGQQVAPASGWGSVGTEYPTGSVILRTWRVPTGEEFWVDDVSVRPFAEPEPIFTLGPAQWLGCASGATLP